MSPDQVDEFHDETAALYSELCALLTGRSGQVVLSALSWIMAELFMCAGDPVKASKDAEIASAVIKHNVATIHLARCQPAGLGRPN